MQIFAKRKRKEASKDATAALTERTSFASDPIVEELLTKDPSKWNSKEKRMVKRYQKRKPEVEQPEDSQKNESEVGETVEETTVTEAAVADPEPTKSEEAAKEDKSEDSDSDDNDDSDSSDSENEDESKDETEIEESTPKNLSQEEPSDETSKPVESTNDSGIVDPSHAIFKQLDKLNSKMKRTLSRKLDRDGASALEEVQKEAISLLEKSEGDLSKKRSHDQGDGKSKKKKSKVDWSGFSPEERARREKQRKLQTEAAERRAKGEETGGYKHPLNSERRRANRRKPKWKNTFKREEKKNHHASGFVVRKEK
jgi:hypothetical protein